MITDIKDMIFARDFVPFEIHMRGGKVYSVPTREHAWVNPWGTLRVVAGVEDDPLTYVLNPALIESVVRKGYDQSEST